MKARPQLSIDTTPLKEDEEIAIRIFKETDKYSVTPTTFKARSFSSHDTPLRTEVVKETIGRVATEKDNLILRYKEFERYEQESQEQLKKLSRDIISDGEFTKPNKDILALGEKFIPKINSLEIYSKELEQYQSFIKENHRDCIDIALKIAFGLNQWHDPIDLNDITSFNFITEVSNQQDITNSLFFDGTEATVRIRQASNDIIRKQTNKLLDVFDQQIKGFRAYFSNIDLGTHIKELIIKAFNQPYDPNIYSEGIGNLKLVYQENAMIFKNEIDKEINLLGEALEEV